MREMTKGARKLGILGAVLGLAAVTAAATAPDATIQPASRVWIEGGSTVRGYTCEAAAVNGSVDSEAAAFDVAALEGVVRGAEIVIDAQALDCGNGTMNSHMRKALKVDDHGSIRFELNDYAVRAEGGAARVTMDGTLEIAGSRKAVRIEGVATPEPNGAVRVAGSHGILMTDYGVKPPTLMLGTMKVHDAVTLNFDVVLLP